MYYEKIGYYWKIIIKSLVMRVSRREESLQIKIGNRELKEVDHFKYLGSVLRRYGYHKGPNIDDMSYFFQK